LSTGFPIDKAAITEIFHSEYISTLDHLREEKALFTPEYFQEAGTVGGLPTRAGSTG
jgi:hypothetical protein